MKLYQKVIATKSVILFCNILVILAYVLFYEINKWGNRSEKIIRVLVETQEDDYNYWQIRNSLIEFDKLNKLMDK